MAKKAVLDLVDLMSRGASTSRMTWFEDVAATPRRDPRGVWAEVDDLTAPSHWPAPTPTPAKRRHHWGRP